MPNAKGDVTANAPKTQLPEAPPTAPIYAVAMQLAKLYSLLKLIR